MSPDPKNLWLDTIWQEIHALLAFDAYFRLWVRAQEAANIPHGPIAQTMMGSYATYQLAAIRRICDRRLKDDVISLPKLLETIKQEQPHRAPVIDSLVLGLKTECDELYHLANQYVAHNADPQSTRNWRVWNLTSAQLITTHKIICEVAIILERDLLSISQRTHLIRVYQGDVLAEVRPYVPADKLPSLRQFWDAHNAVINHWANVRMDQWIRARCPDYAEPLSGSRAP
jgi:hypothetical protein